MDWKKASFGLGLFSLALGAVEIIGARRIAQRLGAGERKGLVRAFGVREIIAGVGLVQSPANASGVWGRVAGDAMDLIALSAAASRAPRRNAVWGALAFVASATLLDIIVARGLDRTTGKTFPVNQPA